MRLLNFRVRTLMLVVGLVGLVLWGAMMGSRSYKYDRLAKYYEFQGEGWAASGERGNWDPKFISECTEYFAELTRKYRRAMGRPWMPVAADPHAPGYDQMVEQERREKALATEPAIKENEPAQTP